MREDYPKGYTLKEKAYVETMRWFVDKSTRGWTKTEIKQGTLVPPMDNFLKIPEAVNEYVRRGLLDVDESGNAHRFQLKAHEALTEDQREFCADVYEGKLPDDLQSKQAGRRKGVPKTTLRIMRALSSNMKKSYSIDELAEAFKLAPTTVRMPMLRFQHQGYVESQKSHRAVFVSGKSPTYYYLTENGRKAFHEAYAKASEHEKRWFQDYSARDLLAVEKIGQWIDPKDDPFELPPDEVTYIETGVRPEVSDDDEIEI